MVVVIEEPDRGLDIALLKGDYTTTIRSCWCPQGDTGIAVGDIYNMAIPLPQQDADHSLAGGKSHPLVVVDHGQQD